MGYTPKHLTGNVNVSKTHPLIEFLWLLGSVIILIGVFFLVVVVSADWAVSKTPISVETWIGQLALDKIPAAENLPLEHRLQKLLDSCPRQIRSTNTIFTSFLPILMLSTLSPCREAILLFMAGCSIA